MFLSKIGLVIVLGLGEIIEGPVTMPLEEFNTDKSWSFLNALEPLEVLFREGGEETSAQALEVTSLGDFELNDKLSVNENPKLKRMTSFIKPRFIKTSELKVNESNVSEPNEQNKQNSGRIFTYVAPRSLVSKEEAQDPKTNEGQAYSRVNQNQVNLVSSLNPKEQKPQETKDYRNPQESHITQETKGDFTLSSIAVIKTVSLPKSNQSALTGEGISQGYVFIDSHLPQEFYEDLRALLAKKQGIWVVLPDWPTREVLKILCGPNAFIESRIKAKATNENVAQEVRKPKTLSCPLRVAPDLFRRYGITTVPNTIPNGLRVRNRQGLKWQPNLEVRLGLKARLKQAARKLEPRLKARALELTKKLNDDRRHNEAKLRFKSKAHLAPNCLQNR